MSVPVPQPARQSADRASGTPGTEEADAGRAPGTPGVDPDGVEPGSAAGGSGETLEPPRRRRRLTAGTAVGLVLLLVGVGALGWVGYQYFGTNVVSEQVFEQETSSLRETWENEPAPSDDPAEPGQFAPRPVPGNAIALLRIPAFGPDYEVPILAGTDLDILSRGVGHYENTADPGAVGNFAVAGHRITHGQPFAKLLELDKGDEIVVETRKAIFTYVVDTPPRELTVQKTAGWVLDPVPGEPASRPTRALITLTTCQDLFHSPDRSVGFGHLQSTTNKE